MGTKAPHRVRLEGTLTSADMRQTTPTYIDVPEGVTDINFLFAYAPKQGEDQRLPYQISLMIFDPSGPRMEVSHPNGKEVFLNAVRASPGGTPGPILAGQWMVYILVHRLLSDTPVAYQLDVTMSFEPIGHRPHVWERGRVAPRGPG